MGKAADPKADTRQRAGKSWIVEHDEQQAGWGEELRLRMAAPREVVGWTHSQGVYGAQGGRGAGGCVAFGRGAGPGEWYMAMVRIQNMWSRHEVKGGWHDHTFSTSFFISFFHLFFSHSALSCPFQPRGKWIKTRSRCFTSLHELVRLGHAALPAGSYTHTRTLWTHPRTAGPHCAHTHTHTHTLLLSQLDECTAP